MIPLHDYLQRIGDFVPDEALKNNIFTGTPLDFIISASGGIPKGQSILVYGTEGSGKTTVLLDALSNLMTVNPDKKFLYISAESSARQLLPFASRFPKFNDILTFFITKHQCGKGQTKKSLEDVLKKGWDGIVVDSIAALVSKIRYEDRIPDKEALYWLTSLLDRQCDGDNERNIPSSVLAIQQVTKKGDARGSNELKHKFDATMQLQVVDKNDPFSERFIVCPKNRYSPSLPLYYDLTEGTNVEYDSARLFEEIGRMKSRSTFRKGKKDMYEKLKELFPTK